MNNTVHAELAPRFLPPCFPRQFHVLEKQTHRRIPAIEKSLSGRHGNSMACEKHGRTVNQMGKTIKTLSDTVWQGNGMGSAWAPGCALISLYAPTTAAGKHAAYE